MFHEISLKVNGELYTIAVKSNQTLLQVLREDLGITSPKRTAAQQQAHYNCV